MKKCHKNSFIKILLMYHNILLIIRKKRHADNDSSECIKNVGNVSIFLIF